MIEENSEAFRRLGYHPVASERQEQIYLNNRELFLNVYEYIDNLGIDSREKALALTNLQQALMWLNAHVACNSVGVEDAAAS